MKANKTGMADIIFKELTLPFQIASDANVSDIVSVDLYIV